MTRSRHETLTQKVGPERTGLKAGLYVHVDFRGNAVEGIRISGKHKDGQGWDRIATALGDALTDMVRAVQERP